MARVFRYFEGKGKWFHHLRKPDSYEGEAPKWKFDFYPKDWNQFQSLGLRNKVKEDNDGKYVTLSRPTVAPWGEPMAPPKIIDQEGAEIPPEVIIGNGSEIILKLEVYTYENRRSGKEATASRIDSIKVTNLVEYKDPKTDAGAQTEGFTAVPF